MPQFILSNANRRRWMLALALCFSLTATAQGLPRAKNPEEVGLSSERLKRLSETFKGEIGKGIMPGAVLLIARRGKVAHYEALGVRDPQTSDAMPVDAIFRLASMTKPMVSMAIMMLVEEGRMALTDPLSRYLPEFKNLQVGVEQKDASGETRLVLEPMRREMTIQDLLRHTAGLTYGQFGEKTLVKREYDKAALSSFELTTAEYFARLAKLPLAHQPGSTWDYSVATDVLGRVLEVVHGQDLDTVLRERVTRPLAMRDTGFSAPPASHARIAEPFVDKKTGRRIYGRDIAEPPKRFGGGGGQCRGLCALLPDAVKRRRARWRAFTVEKHRGVDDGKSSADGYPLHHSFLPARPGDALAGGGAGLGAGLCGAHRRGQEPAARFGRRILLERRVRHGVLGRSEGTNDRHHDGAGTCAAALASAAVSGNRELNGRAAPRGGGRS